VTRGGNGLGETKSLTQLGPVRSWIVNHDNSRLFVVLYIGLAVVLSIWIGLFWLVVVVGAHFVLEWIRQAHLRDGFIPILFETLWELKLDIALVLFALALSLYLDLIFGVVGIGSAARLGAAARAGARSGARFAAWQRTIRGILLSLDDAAQVIKAVLTGKKRPSLAVIDTSNRVDAAALSPMTAEPEPDEARSGRWGSWGARWGKGDWISFGLGVICLLLIVFAPLLTHHTVASMLMTLTQELQPFPVVEVVEVME
jgi:hypothetical protein